MRQTVPMTDSWHRPPIKPEQTGPSDSTACQIIQIFAWEQSRSCSTLIYDWETVSWCGSDRSAYWLTRKQNSVDSDQDNGLDECSPGVIRRKKQKGFSIKLMLGEQKQSCKAHLKTKVPLSCGLNTIYLSIRWIYRNLLFYKKLFSYSIIYYDL